MAEEGEHNEHIREEPLLHGIIPTPEGPAQSKTTTVPDRLLSLVTAVTLPQMKKPPGGGVTVQTYYST
jgi:hypothetical protein